MKNLKYSGIPSYPQFNQNTQKLNNLTSNNKIL